MTIYQSLATIWIRALSHGKDPDHYLRYDMVREAWVMFQEQRISVQQYIDITSAITVFTGGWNAEAW